MSELLHFCEKGFKMTLFMLDEIKKLSIFEHPKKIYYYGNQEKTSCRGIKKCFQTS